MAGSLNRCNLSRRGTLAVFDFVFRNLGIRLPAHLVQQINDYLHSVELTLSITQSTTRYLDMHPALSPPASGRCMLQELPAELRHKLLGYFLPDKDVTIHPLSQQQVLARTRDTQRTPNRNTVSDLMVLSKQFKTDAARCVYSERFFAIHVYEGIHDGGIEFLDTGRQPLHYKSNISDTRFTRFDDAEFGFNQLKKIEITIHPSTEQDRHSAMTTYYINHALVRMLERSGVDDRIVSLTIKFAQSAQGATQASHTHHQFAHNEHAWWNHEMVRS